MAPCIIKMIWWWQHQIIYKMHGVILSPIWFLIFLSTGHVVCKHLNLKYVLLAFTKYLSIFLPNLIANLHMKSCLLSKTNELEHDKTNKMTCAPSEDSDQPGHLPSLISLRCLHEGTMGHTLPTECTGKTLIRLCWWAQADLSLSWAHMSFCWFCRPVTQIFWSCDLDNIMYSLIISSWSGWCVSKVIHAIPLDYSTLY